MGDDSLDVNAYILAHHPDTFNLLFVAQFCGFAFRIVANNGVKISSGR